MESFLRDLIQPLVCWWWYGMDGRTKTANITDVWLLPLLLACSATALLALLWFW